MSGGRASPPKGVEQPEAFAFTGESMAEVKMHLAKYPEERKASAVLPLLWIAQKQHENWLPEAAMREVGDMLEMPYMRVYEVATFFTMFNLAPVGKWFIQVCGTTPCWLCGSDDVYRAIRDELHIGVGDTSTDGDFTVVEVECLGACSNAPMLQLNDEYYEDLTYERTVELLRALKEGEVPEPGPMSERQGSEPAGGLTTLKGFDVTKRPEWPNLPGNGVGKDTKSTPIEKARPERRDPETEAPKSKSEAKEDAPSLDDAARPPALAEARGGKGDDLKRINGIGPKIEGILHELGIFHFDQIAVWTEEQKEWVNGYLKFKGRIDREQWIEQATKLAKEKEGET